MTKLKKYVVANDEIKKQNNFYKKNIIPIFIFVMVLAIMLSIGYAALNQNLSISGEAFLRVKEDVRITGIASSGCESEGYETYTPEYYKKSLKLYNTLPNAASKITYAGEISNTTSIKYKVSSVTITSTDTNVECTSDLVENAVISPGKTTFYVVAKYKDGITVDQTNTDSVCNVNYEFDVYDFTPPTLTVRLVSQSDLNATFNIVVKDEDGGSGLSSSNIYKYCLSSSSTTSSGCTWRSYVSGSDFTDSAITDGTYYLLVYAVSDNAGNVSSGKANNGVYYSAISVQLYKRTTTFDYTGSEQIFTAPVDGYYKLETWGAQGGTHSTSIGGYGGYSVGVVKLSQGQQLYINVGGTTDSSSGGYNGGGTGVNNTYGTGRGGGGATHISTSTGLLSAKSSQKDTILIVSGGGGGGASWTNGNQYYSGGSGGGISGVTGNKHTSGTTTTGGTQTSGGSFGRGNNGTSGWAGGAGSGYYGGTSGSSTAGAGGSGYIANGSLLTYDGVTKHMYCYNCTTSTADSTRTESNGTSSCTSETATTNCAKSGNGYSKITLIEIDSTLNLTPVINKKPTSIDVTINIENKTGSDLSSNNIYKYYVSTSETSLTGGNWNVYTPGTTFNIKKKSDIAYLWIYSISTEDGTINDSLSSSNIPYMVKKLDFILKSEFSYTGSEQTFTAPADGYYKLETWGAQGGTHSTSIGGYGGYSVGVVKLSQGQQLYINVGGTTDSSSGGYNGGGTGVNNTYGTGRGGGGATHISTSTGLLSAKSSQKDTILIVSGGGGGGASWTNGNQYYSGGSGGGISGVTGNKHTSGTTTTGGTQTSGGSFGRGNNGTSGWAGGAGSGYYGGTSGSSTAGAGGSGYIANGSLLTYDGVTKHMYCYNCTTSTADSTRTESNGTSSCTSETATADCAKAGAGYAKITLIKADSALSLIPTVNMKSTVANITVNIKNTTGSDLSSNNIYKYYISTSEISLVGGSWNDYTPGTAFTANGLNETKYLWLYSISTSNGTINDDLDNKDTPYMAETLVFVLSPEEYVYTGTVQTFIAPLTGTYEITLYGAKGGAGGLGLCSGGSGGAGGNGGYVKATVTLEANETYIVWVGGKGTDSSYGDTQLGTGGLSDGSTGVVGSGVSGGGGGGGGSTYFALGDTVYLRANGGGGGGGGADGGWYRNSSGSTTCGGCKYRNMGAAGARGGNGGGGTLGGSGAANTCQASGYAGSNGTYYINQSYSTLVESGSTGTGDGKAIIKHIS